MLECTYLNNYFLLTVLKSLRAVIYEILPVYEIIIN